MHTLDIKMEAWRTLYSQLKAARERYKEAASRHDPELPNLKAEIDQLQRKCGIALDEMQAELAKLKTPGDSLKD